MKRRSGVIEQPNVLMISHGLEQRPGGSTTRLAILFEKFQRYQMLCLIKFVIIKLQTPQTSKSRLLALI